MRIKYPNLFFIGHSIYLKDSNVFDPNYAITFGFLNHYFKDNYSVIRHSLYKSGETRFYNFGVEGGYKKIPLVGYLPDFMRYFFESLVNLAILLLYRPNTVLGIDPLSCFIPVFLKKFNLINKVYFITPDYAKRRFDNPILNKAYYLLDKYCTLNSDKNICCSTHVINTKSRNYNIKDINTVFFHMPNIPNPWTIEKYNNYPKVKNSLIYVGNISSQLNFKELFYSVLELIDRYPDISLKILGSGDLVNSLNDILREKSIENIRFMGHLSHADTLEQIARAEIGIAVYNGSFNYDEFRDSCKIREYQALGTIPISTPVAVSNRMDIEKFKSGILVNSMSEIKEALIRIFDDPEFKKTLSTNSIRNSLFYIDRYDEYYKLIKM